MSNLEGTGVRFVKEKSWSTNWLQLKGRKGTVVIIGAQHRRQYPQQQRPRLKWLPSGLIIVVEQDQLTLSSMHSLKLPPVDLSHIRQPNYMAAIGMRMMVR